ncbi:MAG: hypothetical protein DMF26_17325 [Verrucomicrobia bacterium]|nr:MAG: hypothetical protein DMF26_17325 [Verrucomicrobiota bacterium]
MKKTLFLSMFIASAVICSCQKQDSTAEAQLAQRKTELDVREEALVQREKAVDEREKAVAEKEKAVANNRIIQSQRQAPDAAQAEAERQRRIQQLPPEIRALIPDRSQANSANVEKDRMTGDPRAGAQRPRAQQDAQRKKPMSGAKASPEAEIPEPEATSPSPSPTPE